MNCSWDVKRGFLFLMFDFAGVRSVYRWIGRTNDVEILNGVYLSLSNLKANIKVIREYHQIPKLVRLDAQLQFSNTYRFIFQFDLIYSRISYPAQT